MHPTRTFDLPDPAATQAFGQRLGSLLFPGAVVGLVGPLGAGKTFLTRAIAEGLGIADSRAVSSPTFVLIQEYDARLPIFHFDAYRLASAASSSTWRARIPRRPRRLPHRVGRSSRGLLPAERLTLTLEVTGEVSRRIRAEASGAAYGRC